MAIVRSLGIGAARKSAGELTYRHYKGRTIATRKILENKSKTDAQVIARTIFKFVQYFANAGKSVLSYTYQNEKYGTPSNEWFKKNYAFLNYKISGSAVSLFMQSITANWYFLLGYSAGNLPNPDKRNEEFLSSGFTAEKYLAYIMTVTYLEKTKIDMPYFAYANFGKLDSVDLSESYTYTPYGGSELTNPYVTQNFHIQIRPEDINGVTFTFRIIPTVFKYTTFIQKAKPYPANLKAISFNIKDILNMEHPKSTDKQIINLNENGYIFQKIIKDKNGHEIVNFSVSQLNPLGYYDIYINGAAIGLIYSGIIFNNIGQYTAIGTDRYFFANITVSEGRSIATSYKFIWATEPKSDDE